MKITTKLTLCDDPTTVALEKAIQETLVATTKSLLILASDADKWNPDKVDALLAEIDVPVFGGIFPYIIFEGRQLNQGTLVIGLNILPELLLVENLSKNKNVIDKQLESGSHIIKNTNYLMTIVDGLTENIERFTEGLYEIAGKNSTTIGCGAGSLDFIKRPCLFSNKGLIYDAAMIAAIPTPFKLGISHGYEVLEGPYLVTKSNGNTLESLNYLPAFDVYKESIEKKSELKFSECDFFEIARAYPLGIENLEGEILVREPILLEGKALICVGEVPENSVIYILKGKSEDLILAAGEAAKIAYDKTVPASNEDISVILFDCIGRALFLGDDFDKELNSIKESLNGCSDVFGALALGEIGNSINGPIEWLNKSTTIAVF